MKRPAPDRPPEAHGRLLLVPLAVSEPAMSERGSMRDFSALFVNRPILAAVLSILLLFVDGLITIPLLPVTEYPDVVHPSVQVQNRVNQALPHLPEDVCRLGVTTEEQSPNMTLVAHLLSPSRKYDTLYLSNFATLRVKDELARIDGVGQAVVFGGGC